MNICTQVHATVFSADLLRYGLWMLPRCLSCMKWVGSQSDENNPCKILCVIDYKKIEREMMPWYEWNTNQASRTHTIRIFRNSNIIPIDYYNLTTLHALNNTWIYYSISRCNRSSSEIETYRTFDEIYVTNELFLFVILYWACCKNGITIKNAS